MEGMLSVLEVEEEERKVEAKLLESFNYRERRIERACDVLLRLARECKVHKSKGTL